MTYRPEPTPPSRFTTHEHRRWSQGRKARAPGRSGVSRAQREGELPASRGLVPTAYELALPGDRCQTRPAPPCTGLPARLSQSEKPTLLQGLGGRPACRHRRTGRGALAPAPAVPWGVLERDGARPHGHRHPLTRYGSPVLRFPALRTPAVTSPHSRRLPNPNHTAEHVRGSGTGSRSTLLLLSLGLGIATFCLFGTRPFLRVLSPERPGANFNSADQWFCTRAHRFSSLHPDVFFNT